MTYRSATVFSIYLLITVGLLRAQEPNAPVGTNSVSLIRLIAEPKPFDGRRVRLVGYLDYNGIDKAVGLYVGESDGRNFILMNSLDLEVEDSAVKKLIGKYVVLDATFHAPKDSMAYHTNGHLTRASGIKLWQQGDLPK